MKDNTVTRRGVAWAPSDKGQTIGGEETGTRGFLAVRTGLSMKHLTVVVGGSGISHGREDRGRWQGAVRST